MVCKSQPRINILDFADAIHGSKARLRILGMLRSYFDDTGDPKDVTCRVFGIVGLLAPASVWHATQAEWEDVLECFNIEAFHAVDFAHFTEQFTGWTEYERQRLLAALVEVIQRRIGAFALIRSAVVMQDFKRLNELQLQRARDPYFLCAHWAFGDSLSKAEKRWNGEPISFVFDRRNKSKHYLLDAWNQVVDEHPLGHLCSALTQADHRQVSPVQVADLFAYESNKYINGTMDGKAPDDLRWPVEQLRELFKGGALFNYQILTRVLSDEASGV